MIGFGPIFPPRGIALDLRNSTADAAQDEAIAPGAIALISLIEELEGVVRRMDAEGLTLAGNHVSRGVDLIRKRVESIQIGGS